MARTNYSFAKRQREIAKKKKKEDKKKAKEEAAALLAAEHEELTSAEDEGTTVDAPAEGSEPAEDGTG